MKVELIDHQKNALELLLYTKNTCKIPLCLGEVLSLLRKTCLGSSSVSTQYLL